MPPLRQFRVITQSLRMSHAACSTSRQPAGWHKYLQTVAKKEINECEHYFFGLSLKLSFNRLSSCFHSCQTEPQVNCVSLSITYIRCYSLLILSIHPSDKEGKLQNLSWSVGAIEINFTFYIQKKMARA